MSSSTDLIGSRCPRCERSYFPPRTLCPQCHTGDLPLSSIGGQGVLATWTVVRVGKAYPTPYAIGYADFPGDVRILGRISNWAEGAPVRHGSPVTIDAVSTDDDQPRTEDFTFRVHIAPSGGPS
jgi:uncharacterized protein